MQDDWRLNDQMDYLYRVKLIKTDFKATATNDHEHCEFCFDKFGEYEGWQKSGYCTLDRYYWICNECYQDFHKQFEWDIVKTD